MIAAKCELVESLTKSHDSSAIISEQLEEALHEIKHLKEVADNKEEFIIAMKSDMAKQSSEKEKTVKNLETTISSNARETMQLREDMNEIMSSRI